MQLTYSQECANTCYFHSNDASESAVSSTLAGQKAHKPPQAKSHIPECFQRLGQMFLKMKIPLEKLKDFQSRKSTDLKEFYRIWSKPITVNPSSPQIQHPRSQPIKNSGNTSENLRKSVLNWLNLRMLNLQIGRVN